MFASGFHGAEAEFALGSVTGVRWWNLTLPFAGPPYLSGVQGTWSMGENTAACRLGGAYHRRMHHVIPDENCGCGFWAYWTVDAAPNPWGFTIPVLGVIEGYGRTLIGGRGFRCAKARMVALHFSEGTRNLIVGRSRPAWELSDAPDSLKAKGQQAVETWLKLTGRSLRSAPPPDPADEDRALARLATLEMDLEERYGVPVYCTRAMMLAAHPPTADYRT